MKKIVLFLLPFFIFFSCLYADQQNCAFCNPRILAYQTFYEDDLVAALYTHKPIMPGHCLIIPKRHIERFEELTDQEALRIFQVIKKVDVAVQEVFDTSAYLLLQKNGREVGQTEPHVHVHYIPRKTNDSSEIKFILKMFIANIKSPIPSEEMNETVEKLHQAMEP